MALRFPEIKFKLSLFFFLANGRVGGGSGDRPGNPRPVRLTSGVGELLEVSSEDVV